LRTLFIVFLLFFLSKVDAQQWVQFSQQASYGTYLNPAYAGFASNLNATIAHRSQYVGLGTKSIGTQYASFSSPFLSSKFGLGVRLINDFIGLQRYTNVDLDMAYHVLEKKHKLSFGLNIGLVQFGLKGDQLTAPDGVYLPGLVLHNDPSLPNTASAGLAPTFSFGAIYAFKNWETGVAIQNLNSPKIKLSNTSNGTIIFLARTINVHSTYVIELNNTKIKPSFFCKTDLNKWQAQINLQVDWRKIFAGVGFRGYNGLNNDAVITMFGLTLKEKVKVAYAYDYNVSNLGNANTGSHEISIKFDLPKSFTQNVKSNIIFNPRSL
jgi:type IX secretion system PorP/SprF family membrane protein